MNGVSLIFFITIVAVISVVFGVMSMIATIQTYGWLLCSGLVAAYLLGAIGVYRRIKCSAGA